MPSKTHYEVLGVHRSSTYGEVRDAWRAIARQLHPDRHASDGEDAMRAHASQFAEASSAWACLGDLKKRDAYDKQLAVLRPPCAICKGDGCTWKQRGVLNRVSTTCPNCHGVGRLEERRKR